MSRKHFNRATVFGVVEKVEQKTMDNDKKTPYLSVEMHCRGDRNGHVRAFGRVFGEKNFAAWLSAAGDGRLYRATGFVDQYVGKKQTEPLTTFNLFALDPAVDQDPRAAFVIVGTVSGHPDFAADAVTVTVDRDGDTPRDFVLHTLDARQARAMPDGDAVEVKGYLRRREIEDEFGDLGSGPILPYILTLASAGDQNDDTPF